MYTASKNLSLESNEVVINATDGYITNIANKIELLGSGLKAVSPAVRGTELRAVLEEMIAVMRTTTSAVIELAGVVVAITPASPTGLAAGPIAGKIAENIFKQLDTKLKLPTLLSRVVEIE